MSRKLEPLTPEALEGLPAPCDSCVFWELGGVRHEPGASPADDDLVADAVVQKHAWHTAHGLEDGPAGRIVRIEGQLVAYALFAAADRLAPRRAPAPRPSDDALLLATAWVEPAHRGQGLGRLLLQSAVKEALRRDLEAVEVYGDRRYREQACVLPTQWLLHEGLEVVREHPRHPLLRLETRRTVRWAESFEHALEGILGRVPRVSAPAPQQVPQRIDRD